MDVLLPFLRGAQAAKAPMAELQQFQEDTHHDRVQMGEFLPYLLGVQRELNQMAG